MSDYKFIFDLDSTVTKEEILPKISVEVNKVDEMRKLTESTMQGEIPFKESFTQRVNILSSIPVDKVQNIVENILLNEKIVKFLNNHKEDCFIVTGNLDVWIEKLIKKIGMENHCFCSFADVDGNILVGIKSIIDKHEVVSSLNGKLIVVGDGNNDAEMISMANIGIGFGGVREIAPAVLKCCTHAIYDENCLVDFLEKFV